MIIEVSNLYGVAGRDQPQIDKALLVKHHLSVPFSVTTTISHDSPSVSSTTYLLGILEDSHTIFCATRRLCKPHLLENGFLQRVFYP